MMMGVLQNVVPHPSHTRINATAVSTLIHPCPYQNHKLKIKRDQRLLLMSSELSRRVWLVGKWLLGVTCHPAVARNKSLMDPLVVALGRHMIS